DAGAKLLQPVQDKFYGDRMGTIEDPFGHHWHVSTHKEDVPPDEMTRRAAAVSKAGQPRQVRPLGGVGRRSRSPRPPRPGPPSPLGTSRAATTPVRIVPPGGP